MYTIKEKPNLTLSELHCYHLPVCLLLMSFMSLYNIIYFIYLI